ncbi:uncharacterized protein LOC105703862 [Orussus abietinus]|uniref:uncharacterized protein LOC105703862 n=1 Tax=Orussus abietinus TaxID=222816 RepID=UPI0006255660|nr:uncharacterized protein LOC105703862 [Orussus abietinus]XP_012288016.1 uncharacterized protein LOC105703862 [Orussus abietinus]
MELLVPTISDIVFKYTWPLPDYKKIIKKKNLLDSPSFDLNVNGIHSSWNLSIRFWKGPEGKKITNPVVLCLNILNCCIEEADQVKIRFQFAVFNADIKHWEYCQVSRTVLELKTTSDIISVGYRDLSIVDRHFKKNGEVVVMVKLQIIQYENEKHTLSQDMGRLLKHPRTADTKLICGGINITEIPVHSCIISARSPVLAEMITPYQRNPKSERTDLNENETGGELQENTATGVKKIHEINNTSITDVRSTPEENGYTETYAFEVDLTDLSVEVTQELLRYIYTDRVDNLDTLASQLLSLAERLHLKGLKEQCERNLIETITPGNVATLLLIADEFSCESLKRAGLAYCEENVLNIHKNFAWKIMEQVNPELFNEVCEAGLGSSKSSNMDDSELSD